MTGGGQGPEEQSLRVMAMAVRVGPFDDLVLIAAAEDRAPADQDVRAFSLAASSFFPVLVLGIFWRRTTAAGAVAGMAAGLGVAVYYIFVNYPFFTRMTGIFGDRWFGVDPIASGAFGVPAGFAVAIIVSLLTPRNAPVIDRLVTYLRRG